MIFLNKLLLKNEPLTKLTSFFKIIIKFPKIGVSVRLSVQLLNSEVCDLSYKRVVFYWYQYFTLMVLKNT